MMRDDILTDFEMEDRRIREWQNSQLWKEYSVTNLIFALYGGVVFCALWLMQ